MVRSSSGGNPTRWMAFAGVWVGLLGGLVVLQAEPLPTRLANVVAGGALVGLAVGAVLYLVAGHAGPGERGPDF